MNFKWALIVIGIMVFTGISHAEEKLGWDLMKYHLKSMPNDIITIGKYPFQNPKETGLFIALTLGLITVDQQISAILLPINI